MTKSIRWAILGVGRFGVIHARVLRELAGVELVGLCGRRPELLEQLQQESSVEQITESADDLLSRAEIDAVTIATHWEAHHELAVAALRQGKHVFLEKPMAASAEQCGELLEEAARSSGFLMVGHICRFDPRVLVAREALDLHRLGRVVSMHARRNLPVAPGNIRLDKISPLMGDGIHDIDLMHWFMGETPTRVFARHVRVHGFRYPDLSWGLLEFGDRAIGVVETNWCLPPNVPTVIDARFEIIGTEGKLSIDCSQGGVSILDSQGTHFPETVYWPRIMGSHDGALRRELSYFRDCIRHSTPPGRITALEAARAVAVVERMEASASCGQPLEIDLPF